MGYLEILRDSLASHDLACVTSESSSGSESAADIDQPPGPDGPTWSELSEWRWGGADATPGIVVEAAEWRRIVTCWPLRRWLEWNRRVDALTLPGATGVAIEQAQHQAFVEIQAESDASIMPASGLASPEPNHLTALIVEGFNLILEEEYPAWAEDESLTVTLSALRASVESHRQSQAAAQSQSNPTTRGKNHGPATLPTQP